MTDETPAPLERPADEQPRGDEQPQGRRRRDPDAEASARRHQLREAEQARDDALADRDRLAERLTTMQRREAERLAAARLAQPGDLWDIGGADLTDLLDEHGDVNPAAVAEVVANLIDTRPGLAAPGPKYPDMAGGRRSHTDQAVTWANILRD